MAYQYGIEGRARAEIFGRNFTAAMARKGDTAERVARVMGVSENTIIGWQTGNAVPGLRNIEKMAEYCGMSITELFESDTVVPETMHSRINSAREKLKLSIEDLSKMTGIESAEIRRACVSDRTSVLTLVTLSKALGKTPEYFLTGVDE